ncbi:hypothetical protein ACLOJK_017523 [Asimina triloba]
MDPVVLGWQFLRQSCPFMALPSAGTACSGDVLARSYASVVSNPADNTSFKIPLRFPADIQGKLGFIFSETKMMKAAEEYKVGKRRKEVEKPKENIIWQPKKLDIKGTSSGTKDDKEIEANIASRGERLQVTREDKNSNVVRLGSLEPAPNSINAGMISNIEGEYAGTNQSGQVRSFLLNTEMPKDLENEKDVSEEECDGVWCEKEKEEALEFMQLKGKESSELSKHRVVEMEIVLAENKLPGDSTMGYCLSQEEGEVLGSRGNEKAYDSEGANRSDAGKYKKITSDKIVRKSRQVHTRTQKPNL